MNYGKKDLIPNPFKQKLNKVGTMNILRQKKATQECVQEEKTSFNVVWVFAFPFGQMCKEKKTSCCEKNGSLFCGQKNFIKML